MRQRTKVHALALAARPTPPLPSAFAATFCLAAILTQALPTAAVTVRAASVTGTQSTQAAATRPTPTPAPITVASLVPSATDLLLASGLGSHLVAVSKYCKDNPAAARLPAVGDYQDTDWERLTSLRPTVLLVFMDRDRLPPGMIERAGTLGTTLEIIKVETVADVLACVRRLGELIAEPSTANAYARQLQSDLDAVRTRVAGRPKVCTLLLLGDDAKGAIGPGGFLDELLTLAGGVNAAASFRSRYPTLDTEQLLTLAPTRIIHLLPGATPAQLAEAKARWARQTATLPAAANVTILTEWYLLQPGSHLADTARAFANALHPDSTPPNNSAPPNDSTPATDSTLPTDSIPHLEEATPAAMTTRAAATSSAAASTRPVP